MTEWTAARIRENVEGDRWSHEVTNPMDWYDRRTVELAAGGYPILASLVARAREAELRDPEPNDAPLCRPDDYPPHDPPERRPER